METHSGNGVGFTRLRDVLREFGAPGERRGKGGGEGSLGFPENAFRKIRSKAFSSGEAGARRRDGGPGGRDEGETEGVSQTVDGSPADIERIAAHLASALRDERSLDYFRLVARAVPGEVIRDALSRALDARSVRRSRAALFVHIVRPHLPRRSLTERPET
jgi:hypothetical protein